MLEYQDQLLNAHLLNKPRNEQMTFINAYRQLPEDDKKILLNELNSMYGVVPIQQNNGVQFAPFSQEIQQGQQGQQTTQRQQIEQGQPQFKRGGIMNYQNGGRKEQISTLQEVLDREGFDLGKSKKRSGKYDGIIGPNTTKAINAFAKETGLSKNDAISYLVGEDSSELNFIQKATDYFDKNPRARSKSKRTNNALSKLTSKSAKTTSLPEVKVTANRYNNVNLPEQRTYQRGTVGGEGDAEAFQLSQATGIDPIYFTGQNRGQGVNNQLLDFSNEPRYRGVPLSTNLYAGLAGEMLLERLGGELLRRQRSKYDNIFDNARGVQRSKYDNIIDNARGVQRNKYDNIFDYASGRQAINYPSNSQALPQGQTQLALPQGTIRQRVQPLPGNYRDNRVQYLPQTTVPQGRLNEGYQQPLLTQEHNQLSLPQGQTQLALPQGTIRQRVQPLPGNYRDNRVQYLPQTTIPQGRLNEGSKQLLLPQGRTNNPYFNYPEDLTGLSVAELQEIKRKAAIQLGQATRMLNKNK